MRPHIHRARGGGKRAAPPNTVNTISTYPWMLMATGQDLIGTWGFRNGHIASKYEHHQSISLALGRDGSGDPNTTRGLGGMCYQEGTRSALAYGLPLRCTAHCRQHIPRYTSKKASRQTLYSPRVRWSAANLLQNSIRGESATLISKHAVCLLCFTLQHMDDLHSVMPDHHLRRPILPYRTPLSDDVLRTSTSQPR